MPEVAWHQRFGRPILVLSVGVVASLGTAGPALAMSPTGGRDAPTDRCQAIRAVASWMPGQDAPRDVVSHRLTAVIDKRGFLTGYRLIVPTVDATVHLPAEAFASGPFGSLLLYGHDDGRAGSAVHAVDLRSGCDRIVARSRDVIRGATLAPAGDALFLHLVRRDSRADLGIWRQALTGASTPAQVLPPLDAEPGFGRTYATILSWDLAGRLVAESCGADRCRARRVDVGSGNVVAGERPATKVITYGREDPLPAPQPGQAAAGPSVTAVGRAMDPTPLHAGAYWSQNQLLEYRWRSGDVPPGWMASAIHAATDDSNTSRGSRAAVLRYASDGDSRFSYTDSITCGPDSIGCAIRSVPESFSIQLRVHGHVFDWGVLRWCQALSSPQDGCFDAEMVTLHELGHVQTLQHVASSAVTRTDSVMHAVTNPRPRAGWNVHRFGRCDVASFQRRYDTPGPSAPYSTCLDLDTTLSLTTPSTSVGYREPFTLTATLKVGPGDHGKLDGNRVSGRDVLIQRRLPGTSGWQTTFVMAQGPDEGTYTYTTSTAATYEWRAFFATPSNEGLNGSSSGVLLIRVAPCSSGPCPSLSPDEDR